jgi:predicted ATPase
MGHCRKEKIFEALLRQVEGLSRRQPVLTVFDDLHWIDPSSRELLDRVIEQVVNWPVLLLATSAPLIGAPAADRCAFRRKAATDSEPSQPLLEGLGGAV